MVLFASLSTFYLAMTCIQIIIGTMSVISGVSSLLLIYFMKVWNQFILLIVNLACSQLIFDLAGYLNFCDPSNIICFMDVYIFFIFYMGIVVTLWTNVIVTVLYCSIVFLEPNIMKNNFYSIFFSIHFFGLLFGTFSVIFYNTIDIAYSDMIYVYNSLRLASIMFNLIVIIMVYHELREYDKNHPAIELTKRLIYYPIVQIITFVPVTWYGYQYYIPTDDENLSIDKQISFSLFSIFFFSSGIGFFIVFLTVQPNAYKFLVSSVKSLFGYKETALNDNLIDYRISVRDTLAGHSFSITQMSEFDLSQLIIDQHRTITISTFNSLH